MAVIEPMLTTAPTSDGATLKVNIVLAWPAQPHVSNGRNNEGTCAQAVPAIRWLTG